MNYTFTNKNGKEQTVDIPEAYIHQQQASLGIGMMEACKLYLSDEGYVENAAIDELTAKATGKPKRKRKEDPIKGAIISELYGLLANGDFRIEEDAADTVDVIHPERIISFTLGDDTYTFTLAKKRKPKE